MGNMGDSELDSAKNMATNYGMPGAGGMPAGGMPNYGYGAGANTSSGTTSTSGTGGADVPSDCKDNYDLAKRIKDEAAKEYKG